MAARWGLLFAALSLGALASAAESELQLKPGPAREKVVSHCAVCHSVDYIQMNSPLFDRKGWQASVDKMIKVMGAPIPPEDAEAVVEYLATYYSR